MALGVVGAVAGTFIGQPQLGFMIGSTIGSLVDPGTVKGPSIGDIANQSAQEGGARPIVFVRSPPIAGNVIAQSDPVITKTKTSGKGGPSYVSESVSRTYAVGVCEGPVGGFRRVWRNNVLVYDATPVPVLPAEDTAAFLEKARFFLGDFDQLPSPDLEAVFGVGTTPAHRGTCYMVMADEDLTDLRGAIPQWTFEVAGSSSEVLSTDVLDPWTADTSDPRYSEGDALGGYEYQYYTGPFFGNVFGSWESSLSAALAAGNAASTDGYQIHEGFSIETDAGVAYPTLEMSPTYSRDPAEKVQILLHYNRYSSSNNQGSITTDQSGTACGPFTDFVPPIAGATSSRYWWSGIYTWTGNGLEDFVASNPGTFRLLSYPAEPIATGEYFLNNCTNYPSSGGYFPIAVFAPDLYIRVKRIPHKPEGEWTAVAGSFKCLAEYDDDGSGIVTQYPLNPTIEAGDDDDTQAFWEAAYNAALADGDVPGGWVYGVDYPQAISSAWSGFAVSIDSTSPLSTVVTQICARAGVPASLLDVTDLQGSSQGEEREVYGLAITNQYPAVEALRALGQMYLFDVSARDGLICFIRRGHDAVATVTGDDLVDEGEEPSDDKRADSISVPRMLHLNYHDVAGGLNTDKQTSERAGDRRSVGEASIQTPIILPANEAAQAVVINHKVVTENSKGEVNFALSDRFIDLCTADCIFFQFEGTTKRLRIENVETLDGYQRYKFAYDRQSAYTSDVEGIPAAPQTAPPSSIVGPTLIVPLDIPILRDADDGFGLSYYVAVAGLTPAWRGALVELSYDGGANYIDSRTALASATIGELTATFADHPQEYPDDNSSLQLRIDTPDAVLEATDLPGMMNRANLAAVGTVTGGWELINFANVDEQSSEGDWTVSYFLRGRRDTTTQEHSAGETFVLLERGLIGFVPAELTDLSRTLTFRATSLGAPTSTGTVVSMFYTGQSQTERHPGYVQVVPGTDSDGANVTVTWQGVGRLGGGAQAAHGVRFDRYRVTFNDNVNAPIVIETEDTEVVQSTVDFAGSIPLIGAYEFSTFLAIQKVVEVSGSILGVTGGYQAESIRKFSATDGTYEGGIGIENPGRITGFIYEGGFIYTSSVNTGGSPDSSVHKIDPADVIIGGTLTPLFTYTGAPGDFQGLATDGTDLFVTGTYSNTVKRLSLANLSVLGTLAVAGAPAACSRNGTNLFVACRGTDQIAVIDLGTLTETARFSCVEFPLDVLATDDLVFVQGTHQLGVYTHAGVNVQTYAAETLHTGAPVTQELGFDGSRVFRGDNAGVNFYSGSGGELSLTVPLVDSGVVGGYAGGLYFVDATSSSSSGGDAYGSITQSPTVTVQQLNDLTGAGPGIEVTLP